MKFCLVGSFNLADGYLGAAKALRKAGHEVDFVPAHFYKSENPANHVNLVIQEINKTKSDVVIWWRAETLTGEEFERARKEIAGKFILYSWDDPYQWEAHKEMPIKCNFLDMAFTCCEGSIRDYETFGCPAIYCPPGFDPEIHYPEEDDNFKCDVSFVCTNLYLKNSLTKFPHFSRKDIIDAILKVPGIDFRLYGLESLKSFYPNNYRGWISFNESRKVFYNSKINLSTHIRPDGYKYINERVCQILGSGGFLLVDYVSGLDNVLKINEECLAFDYSNKIVNQNDFMGRISHIIKNYSDFEYIRENGRKKALEKLTWDSWADIIISGVKNNGISVKSNLS